METSLNWFLLQSTAVLACLWLGIWIGRGPVRRIALWAALALVLLLYWTWLKHNPSIAVRAIPLKILYYIEGTGAVPAFMLIVGIAYGRSNLPRQKRFTVMAMLLGSIYFLQGGLWMLQTTPEQLFAHTVDPDEQTVVLQSQDFSCVPAACATALRDLGVDASESEMAVLTQVRPGTGTTLIRATEALRKKLHNRQIQVHILKMPHDQLSSLQMPLLTPLQLEIGRRHMVVVQDIDQHGVRVADPMRGVIYWSRAEFAHVFTNQVIAFDR